MHHQHQIIQHKPPAIAPDMAPLNALQIRQKISMMVLKIPPLNPPTAAPINTFEAPTATALIFNSIAVPAS